MSYIESAEIDLDNHKLIIVMDHSPYFATSSDPNKWLDSFCQDVFPIIPKSLWACMVESVMEFTRIVWNIFPRDKLIEIIVSNHLAHILNNWDADTQTTEYISGVFASVGQPLNQTPLGQEASILHGLRGAMESLVTYTPLQKVKFFDDLACMAKTQYAKLNRGRIICITSLSTHTDLKVLTDLFLMELSKYNYNAAHSNFQQLPVTHCHLIILNIYPTDTTCEIVDQPPHQVSAELKLELHVIDALHLSDKLAQLLVLEYNLVCTVIDNIPSLSLCKHDHMFSAEMFHLRDIHLDMANEYPEAIRDVRIQGSFYTKLHLHWSFHRLEVTDIITSMTRITPADIKSVGAMRLIKHLYTGKKILLEYRFRDKVVIKYMLAVQDGDIFLHTLLVPREVPSLLAEEIVRAPQYDGDTIARIPDADFFGSDLETCILSSTETAPDSDSTKFYESNTDATTDGTTDAEETCCNESLPIVCSENSADEDVLPYNESILYSDYVKQLLFNLLSTFVRFRLTRTQIDMCCQSIGAMKSNELNHCPLNLPRANIYKNATKSKQYEVLWNELQQFIEDNLFSPDHEIVYKYFKDVVRGENSSSEVEGDAQKPAPSPISEKSTTAGPSTSSDDSVESATRRLNLLDFLVKKTDKTQPQKSEEANPGPSSSSDCSADTTTKRLNLLDFLVKKTDKTQRNRKDKKRGKQNKD